MSALTIPQDYDELFEVWGKEIAQQLKRLNRFPANFEDIYQTICMRLVEADVIGKFHAKITRTRPETLTTEEVVDHFGTTVSAWVAAQEAYQGGDGFDWMPSPVAGDALSVDALWATDDIERFEVEGQFDREDAEDMIPQPTLSKFQQFLSQSVHNAFANFCRTQSRRHKERVIDVFFRPSPGAEGRGQIEDLFDRACPTQAHTRMERSIEIRNTLRRAQLPSVEMDFLGLMAEGYTSSEAAGQLGLTKAQAAEIRSRIMRCLT